MDSKNIQYYKLLQQLIFVIILGIVIIPLLQFVELDTNNQKVAENVTKVEEVKKPEIVDGIHLETGLKVDDNWELVQTNCTRCHTATIVTNNRFTRDGWKDLIVWMQETQGLWKLGTNEDKILDYLAKNYAPGKVLGRRPKLEIKEEDWYVLD